MNLKKLMIALQLVLEELADLTFLEMEKGLNNGFHMTWNVSMAPGRSYLLDLQSF